MTKYLTLGNFENGINGLFRNMEIGSGLFIFHFLQKINELVNTEFLGLRLLIAMISISGCFLHLITIIIICWWNFNVQIRVISKWHWF